MTTQRGGHLLWLWGIEQEKKNIFIAPCMASIKPRNIPMRDAEYSYFLRMCSIKDN